jgi:hypothetical protein
MGMIAKERAQTVLRKGICVVAATSWRAFVAISVYCRIFSVVSKGLGSIVESGKVRGASILHLYTLYLIQYRRQGEEIIMAVQRRFIAIDTVVLQP